MDCNWPAFLTIYKFNRLTPLDTNFADAASTLIPAIIQCILKQSDSIEISQTEGFDLETIFDVFTMMAQLYSAADF